MRRKKEIFVFLLRGVLGLVFIVSGFLKILDLSFFYSTLLSFKILSEQIATIVTYSLPVVEIILGGLLIFSKKPTTVFIFSNILLLSFSALLIAKLFEGEKISCSCFGSISNTPIDYLTILRNLFLVLIGFYLEIHFRTTKLNIRSLLTERGKFYALAFLIASLSLSSVILGAQNRGLKNRIEMLLSKTDVLKAGDTVSSIEVFDSQKNIINLSFLKQKSVLVLIYSNECEPCRKNFINWLILVDSLRESQQVEIIALCIDDFNLTKSKPLFTPPVKTYWFHSLKEIETLKAFSTPQTLIINNGKLKIDSNIGILNTKKIEDILINVLITNK